MRLHFPNGEHPDTFWAEGRLSIGSGDAGPFGAAQLLCQSLQVLELSIDLRAGSGSGPGVLALGGARHCPLEGTDASGQGAFVEPELREDVVEASGRSAFMCSATIAALPKVCLQLRRLAAQPSIPARCRAHCLQWVLEARA